MIGGLDRFDSGNIIVDGAAYENLSQSQLAYLRLHKIGFVFQAYNLIPVLSAIENVEYVMLLQGLPASTRRFRARAILDEVGLAGKYDRRPAALSGGQQQRVAIARALAGQPRFLLADEPTGNLDSEMAEQVMQLLEGINREGTTIVMVTHDPDLAARAQRNIHILDGRASDQPMPAAAVVTKLEARREAAHV
jgi:putative ABC transport system ATP-binding protein